MSKENSYPTIPVHLDAPCIQYLEGMVLTLVEAVTADPTQREAIKSLARQTVWHWGKETQFGYTHEVWESLQDGSPDQQSGPRNKRRLS